MLVLPSRSWICSPVLAPCQRSIGLCHLRRLRATPDNSNEFEGVGGDPDLQEALVEQLRVQVENQTLKDEIKEDLKERVEGLKQIGEELIQQLDEELGIEKFRTELESTQVLSEANEKLNELEEQLQQIKDQIKADEADLRAFETASAAARSQGLFFRSLYQPELGEDEQQDAAAVPARRKPLADPAAAHAAAAVVTSSAEEEVSSPFRMYLFGYMAAVLALVVAQDFANPEPKYALDALYAMLGLLLGINTYTERRALLQVLEKQQQQAAAASSSTSANSNSSQGADSSGSQTSKSTADSTDAGDLS